MRTALTIAALALLSLQGCVQFARWKPLCDGPSFSSFTDMQRWWLSFDDPLINQFIVQLVQHNIDIKIAKERLVEARGTLRTYKSNFLPELNLNTQAWKGNTQVFLSKPVYINQGGFDATWELDIFGHTASRVGMAKHQIMARSASIEDVVNSMIAELCRNIIDWRQNRKIVQETTELLNTQDIDTAIFTSRINAGLIDASTYERAIAQRAQTAAQIPIAEAHMDAAQYAVERLLGMEAGELTEVLQKDTTLMHMPIIHTAIAASIDTVRNRPDVRATRAEMFAAQSDLMRAEADLWPHISIGAFFGVHEGSSSVPLAPNPIWALTSTITGPIVNFGRLQGEIDKADAKAKQAVLNYENSILIALQETRTALSDYLHGLNTMRELRAALDHYKEASRVARERFERGLTYMIDLTTIMRETNQATLLLIEAESRSATSYIRLHKALGTAFAKKEPHYAPVHCKQKSQKTKPRRIP